MSVVLQLGGLAGSINYISNILCSSFFVLSAPFSNSYFQSSQLLLCFFLRKYLDRFFFFLRCLTLLFLMFLLLTHLNLSLVGHNSNLSRKNLLLVSDARRFVGVNNRFIEDSCRFVRDLSRNRIRCLWYHIILCRSRQLIVLNCWKSYKFHWVFIRLMTYLHECQKGLSEDKPRGSGPRVFKPAIWKA